MVTVVGGLGSIGGAYLAAVLIGVAKALCIGIGTVHWLGAEIAFSKKLCAKYNWPLIDVTRRSIEETAAAILNLLSERRRHTVA